MREVVPALTDAPDARAPATPRASTEESRRRLIVEALGIAASAIGFGFVYGLSAREAGFSPLEAISIGTSNGAKYLGRDARVGTIAVGKQADLVVVGGDPSTTIADVRNVEVVFKQGVGFDPVKLIDSVKTKAGLW